MSGSIGYTGSTSADTLFSFADNTFGGTGGGTGVAGNPEESGGSVYVPTGNTVQTNVFTDDILLGEFGGNIANVENPYDQTIHTSTKYTDVYRHVPVYDSNGNFSYLRRIYVGTISTKIYSDNPAYSQFETAVTTAQTTESSQITESQLGELQVQIDDFANTIDKYYDRDVFGDTAAIDDTTQTIGSLEYEIEQLSLQDDLSQNYDRIDDTDNTARIKELEEQLAEAKSQLEDLTVKYDKEKKDFISDITSHKVDNWKWDFYYVPQPDGYDYTATAKQDIKSYMTLNTTDEMNRWMAGGDLYDAPRAGDVAFSVVGNLNTVRFLGLMDTNRSDDMILSHINPERQQMFGELAGEENFSIF
ncbi:MAG: hypothetical protein RQ763_00115 [Sulfurimonas sp.]|uniref:hypothetical protein n=1 Tax=Sulfurimonas sp. TaxID=2022749 RepID=UPI0028CFAA6D|nr:hypothetical protein [Sulfurimonas sp.]MDT8337577.1 hypothetical protein [Sulfurimonas sp.]